MEYLMHYCKNWGSNDCHPDVSKHRHAKELKPGEEIPIWPAGEEQKILDEICKHCESRFFELEGKECPVCGSTDIVDITMHEFSDEKPVEAEVIKTICKNCQTPLQPK